TVARVHSPFRILSEDATHKEWQKIALLVAKEANSSDSQGVVVMHGTDTLHYTSAALSFMLRNLNKPVALVGAQRSPDRGSFDGAMNLACAAVYAASPIAEVAVVMHENESDDHCIAIPGTKARKMHSSRRDAFKAINAQPLARISPNGEFVALTKEFAKRSDGKVVAETGFEPKVAIVKAFPSSTPELIDFYVGKKFKGLVIEGTGLGHVPTSTLDEKDSWLPAIKSAIEEGVVVAMTTQCVYGRVHPLVYANARLLHEAGVVYCSDITSETAFVKLGWLLAKFKKTEDVKRELLVNYAREINPRITGSE
ncbi:Glu-tRNA(Gln) amidotransferase subunit GatD, partial [Candidatus Micrarchaeota archaeon]|nr:Glu-tRNA(Gln) amidotransferase subunit GatD [Candidatus Micrarchaeota archaeon]